MIKKEGKKYFLKNNIIVHKKNEGTLKNVQNILKL